MGNSYQAGNNHAILRVIRKHTTSKKRSYVLCVCDVVTLHPPQWDGGSKLSYIMVGSNGKASYPNFQPAKWPAVSPSIEHTLSLDEFVIRVGISRGEPATPFIYMTEETYKKLTCEEEQKQ